VFNPKDLLMRSKHKLIASSFVFSGLLVIAGAHAVKANPHGPFCVGQYATYRECTGAPITTLSLGDHIKIPLSTRDCSHTCATMLL
jgi:hypothetical protein